MIWRISFVAASLTAFLGALALLSGIFHSESSPAFADEASCDAVHASLTWDGGDECTLDVAIVLNGTHALDHTLHILDQGKITTNVAGGLTLNIDGGFIIDTPFGVNGTNGINGDVVNAFGRSITINATEDVVLHGNGTKGATITSSRTGLGDAPGGGGDITINAGPRDAEGECIDPLSGNITMEPGSRVLANTSKSGAGDIQFEACHSMDIDGLVESKSSQTGAGTNPLGGGPISLIAGCTLTISDTGKVSSRSLDPRGDRVHLEGCDVFIYGIVESVAHGHAAPNGANGCKGPDRPDKPNGVPLPHYPYTNYSTNCVEIWGKSITIDASGTHNGQVNADSGGGGNGGTGWIELDARENITLIGCSTTVAGDCAPDYYLVHANGTGGSGNAPGEGSLGGEEGGLINVASTTGGLTSSGLVFSAFAGNQGSNSDGGSLIIETNTDAALGSSVNDVGGADLRGIISTKSYNGTVTGAAPGLLDTCGNALGAVDGDNTCVPAVPVSPSLVTLQGCGPDNLDGPPNDGVVYTGTTHPTPFTQPDDVCGGAPSVEQYVRLSDCRRCGGTATKSGVKFEDMNGDGVRELTDPLLDGWEIRVYRDDNSQNGDLDVAEFNAGPVAVDTTDVGTGAYNFTLAPGKYIVCEVLQPGWVQSAPNAAPAECDADPSLGAQGYAITLAAGDNDEGNDFGNFRNASKCGSKFHDLNGNGARDNEEPGLYQWKIHLFGTDGMLNPVHLHEYTDEGGNYCFEVPPGNYTVCEKLPADWYQSYPNAATPSTDGTACDNHRFDTGDDGYGITLTSGQRERGNDFGNYQNGFKSGRKFSDVDNDGFTGSGVNNGTDPSLPNWVIHIFGIDGMANPVHEHFNTCDSDDVTGNDGAGDPDGNDSACDGMSVGYYEFSVPPGSYTVCEELQLNWTQTYPNPGTDGAACEGHTHIGTPGPYGYAITLVSQQRDLDNDFGNFRPGLCKWCTKGAVLSQVWQNPGGGDPTKCCLIPDILVDVRLPLNDPVLPSEIGTNQPATGSIQAAIDYVNSGLWVDPTPDEEIFIGVTARDCDTGAVEGGECDGQTGRGPGGHDGSEGTQNVVVTNTRSDRMNIFGCSIDIAAADPNKPVVEIKDSVGKVTVLDIHVWGSHVAGYDIHDNDDLVVVKNSRSIGGSGIGYNIDDDDVEITGSPEISNNDIGILVSADSTNVTLRTNNDINNNGVGIQIRGDGNESNGNDVGQSGAPNGTGIIVDGKDNQLHGDSVTFNTGDGIVVNGSGSSLADGNKIEDEDSQDNGGDGIVVLGHFNSLDGNKQVKFNDDDGINVIGNSNLVKENVADENDGHGINVSGDSNMLDGNDADGNGGDGIHISGDSNTLEENVAEENGGNGIKADSADGASGNTLTDNEGDNNTLQGIRACGQTDGGGNSGSGNGANPQVDFLCLVAGPPVFFVADDPDNMVYKYDAVGVPAGSFALHANNDDPRGVAVVGSDVYVLDSADDMVYRYDAATGAHEATSRDLEQSAPAGGDLGTPAGLAIEGDNLWIADDGNGDEVLQFDLSDAFLAAGSLNALTDIALAADNADPRGLAIDADCLYVLDDDLHFYKLDRPEVGTACAAAVSDLLEDSASDGIDTPGGATLMGTSLWVADAGNDKAYEYNLSAAGAKLFDAAAPAEISAISDFDLDATNDGASGM